MTELRTDDLRFSPEEAAAFLNQVMELNLSPEDIAALDARTEGWIAGLQMAALSMQGRDATTFIRAFSGSHRFILDYLLEEVLDRQPGDVQDFLLKTSILERMTDSLCDAVTDRSDSQAMLSRLEQANLFLVPLDDERRWYRYHHLFADLLRTRLAQTQPDLLPTLHLKASEWLERQGFTSEAIAHALAADDVERAADLVERNAKQMVFRSEHATLSQWLDALPADLVRERPWLCVHRAWTRYWIGPRTEAEQWLQDAERALDPTPSVSSALEGSAEARSLTEAEMRHVAGNIAAVRAYLALQNEELPRVLELAQQAAELLPEGDSTAGMAFLALGGMYWGKGDVTAAERAFAEARAVGLRSGHRSLAVAAACYVGIQQTKRAQLHEALETYRSALRDAVSPDGQQLLSAGYPSLKIGDLLREWNDLENARRHIVEGIERCIRWGPADVVAEGYVALARLQLAQGELEDVDNTLQKAEQVARSAMLDPWNNCWLDDCRVRLWLARGDLEAASRWAQVSGLTPDGEFSYHYDLNHINLARTLVTRGRREPSGPYLSEALGLLTRLLEAAESVGWVHEATKILILQALAFQAHGDGEEAAAALARALMLAQPGGYVRTFIDEGPVMAKLLRQAITRGDSSSYAAKLLAALEDEAEAKERSARPPPLVEPLTDREMEVLRLLTTSLSSTEMAEELFISVNTVRSHIKSIYGKLDVHSRMEAVRRAEELGLT
jgi:LuxR family maltose regulon positive regulatory protein